MSNSYSSRELSKSKRRNREIWEVLFSSDFLLCSGAQSAGLRKLGGPLNCSHSIGQSILEPRSAHINRPFTKRCIHSAASTQHPRWHPHVINATQIPSGGRRHHPYPRVVHKRDVTSQHHCEHQVLLQSRGHTWSCSWHWKRCVQRCSRSNDSALRLACTWTTISWKIQLPRSLSSPCFFFFSRIQYIVGSKSNLWGTPTIERNSYRELLSGGQIPFIQDLSLVPSSCP